MARPWSVQSLLGKRPTKTSVSPLLTARWMIAAARFMRSSSDTPDGLEKFANSAFFSSSSAARLRAAAAAFSASASASFCCSCFAVGSRSSIVVVMDNSILPAPGRARNTRHPAPASVGDFAINQKRNFAVRYGWDRGPRECPMSSISQYRLPRGSTGTLGPMAPAVDYLMDALQRSILFWDVMRERGNQYHAHLAETAPHVLDYTAELVVDGRK